MRSLYLLSSRKRKGATLIKTVIQAPNRGRTHFQKYKLDNENQIERLKDDVYCNSLSNRGQTPSTFYLQKNNIRKVPGPDQMANQNAFISVQTDFCY